MRSTSPADAADWFSDVARDVWQVREHLPIDEWCDRYRTILPKGNPEPGPWRTARTPYMRDVMRSVADPTVSQVTVRKASQLGFTELAFNAVMYWVDQDPGPVLAIYPNIDISRRTVKKRVLPTIKSCTQIAHRLGQRREDQTAATIVFDNMDVVFTGSGSPTNMRSTPFRRVIIDDFDLCEAGTLEEAEQRGASFAETLLLAIGTPSFVGMGIDAQYTAGDRRSWFLPCPHCGEYQTLEWEQLRWQGGLKADPTHVQASAWVECAACKAAIHNHHKAGMLARGVWAREGQRVERDGTLSGDAVRGGSHHSYTINALSSPFKTFGWVARRFLESGGQPGRDWTNGVLGRAWSPKGASLGRRELEAMRKPVAEGGYVMGEVPAGVLLLTAAVDVQDTMLWMLVEGWGERGRESWWVWSEAIESPRGSNLWQLGPWTQRKFKTADGRELGILLWFIDSGHRTEEVYEFCRAVGRSKAFPVKGQPRGRDPYWTSRIEKYPNGKPMPPGQGLQLLHVNGQHWTEHVMTTLINGLRPPEEPDAEVEEDALIVPAGRRHLPANMPNEHLAMLDSEQLIDGQWVLKAGRRDNHLLDCTRYSSAGAIWAGVRMVQTPRMTDAGGAVVATPARTARRDPALGEAPAIRRTR